MLFLFACEKVMRYKNNNISYEFEYVYVYEKVFCIKKFIKYFLITFMNRLNDGIDPRWHQYSRLTIYAGRSGNGNTDFVYI